MNIQTVTIIGDLAKLNDHDGANRANKWGNIDWAVYTLYKEQQ